MEREIGVMLKRITNDVKTQLFLESNYFYVLWKQVGFSVYFKLCMKRKKNIWDKKYFSTYSTFPVKGSYDIYMCFDKVQRHRMCEMAMCATTPEKL